MIVEMKKLVLMGHSSRRNRILRALHRSKIVEVSTTREIENTQTYDNSTRLEELQTKQSRVANALTFMKAEKKDGLKLVDETKKAKDGEKFDYKPVKGVPFQSVATLSYEEFTNIPAREVELMANLSELEDIQSRYTEINSDKLKAKNFIEQLEVYSTLDGKFSDYADTKFTSTILGYVPMQQKPVLDEIIAKFADKAEFQVYEGGKFQPFAVTVLNADAEEILSSFQALEFTRCNYTFDKTANALIADEKAKIEKLNAEKTDLLVKSLAKEGFIAEWKQLYDYYLVEIAKQTAAASTRCTKSVFVLEGWFPASEEERLKAILDDCCKELIYEFREPEAEEIVPTLVKSKKLFDPYEDVTNMYSAPNYREDFDPNPLMSFFYFLFFGMMLADAVYGLLLAIGGFVLYKLKKPVPGKGRLLLIIAMGGISSAIWGVLFGSYLGFPTATMMGADGNPLNLAVLFNPLDKPLYMLGLSLGLGFLQIIVGMGCNAYNLIRKGRVLDAVFAVFTWYLAFIGIGLFALNMLFWNINALNITAIVCIAVGLGFLVLGNARGKKGIGGKIKGAVGGLAKLYDGVNILSDILSYSRLFGLALSGGVVAMVVNMIVETIAGFFPASVAFIGYIICIPIYFVGHAFNVAISALGAYVHDSRLQYIEYYGKFYAGGGHLFKPLGNDTKYIYINNKLAQDEVKSGTSAEVAVQ